MARVNRKKGFFFTLDALFATILIGLALILTSKYFISEVNHPQLNYYSQDVVTSLSNIKITEVDDTYVQYLISTGEIINLNNSVIEQIGEFYVLNKTELARNLSFIVSEKLIPDKFGFEILVNNESIYLNDSPTGKNTELVSSRRLISGIEKFKPLKGATSKVYLKGIRRKKYSSYLYFGGFVGQGNISGFITLPTKINVTGLYLELDSGSDFNFYVNDISCGGTFSAGAGIMTADSWNISSCDSSIVKGAKNNFSISFLGDIGQAFVGGGFVRVDYHTDVLQQEPLQYNLKEWLPNIEGIINLYSSFYVPGTLENISIYLHYFINATNATNNTFYVTIGNATVFKDDNLTGEKNHTVLVQNITQFITLSSMDAKTVPIRAGFENVSFGFIFEGNADVGLITDVSGSMDWNFTDSTSGIVRSCDNPNLNLLSTQRLSVAKCLDKQFAADIINITGNKVGLVSYRDTTDDILYPIINLSIINSTINAYTANDATCICCGINSARDILVENYTSTVFIDQGQNWLYENNYFFSTPPNDGEGDGWFERLYDDVPWSSGPAILGSTNSYVYNPVVVTELGNDIGWITQYANLWENTGDNTGPPNDFTSGTLNSTANTFGLSSGDDGWDTASGFFDYSGAVIFDMSSGRIRIDSQATSIDVSGAYGIEVNVTPALYNILTTGGQAILSFDWSWDDRGGFSSSDGVWVKGIWNSSNSGGHYLGGSLDGGFTPSDATDEIYADNDPDGDRWDQAFSQNIETWIEGPGMYYLVLGGKLRRNDGDDNGHWMFDNIQLEFRGPRADVVYANLWEDGNDLPGPPNDFTSGNLNTTANTFGIGAGDDGWDSASNVYDYSNNVQFDGVQSGRIRINSQDNTNDVSGAYGIEINITQEMYDILNTANGQAVLSFDWSWDDRGYFESTDGVWVKSTWNSSTSGIHYLGNNLDSGFNPSDTSNEIYADNDPDGDRWDQEFSQSIGSWIESPGTYYLTLGGKLYRNNFNEDGHWMFDNIEIKITNLTNNYYFRKHFTVTSLDQVEKGVLSVLSDDFATVYLNGMQIDADSTVHDAQYWNRIGKNIPRENFRVGDNVVAVKMVNADRAAKFDLKLVGVNNSRSSALMVMTDGQANRQCAEQGTGSSTQDAIQAACDARQDWGITVYAVGYSDDADEAALQGIAECGDGIYTKSDNVTVLQEFYQDVASTIISATRHSQTIEIEGSGDIAASILYGDSFINIDYTPIVDPPDFGEISIIVEEKNFPNCSFNVFIPGDVRVSNSKLTSYSSEHWTDALIVNNNSVYNLSTYSTDYAAMGDPFIINIPVPTLQAGNNSFFIRTGDSPSNYTECSKNNTLIYTAQFTASVSYSDVLEKAIGCEWSIEFEDGGTTTVKVPPTYSGAKQCFYTNATISYDVNDTYDDAMYNLLDNLDFDNNGRIYVNIEEQNFVIGAISVGKIPYPWGPALAEVRVWR